MLQFRTAGMNGACMEKIKKYLAVWLVICIFGVLFAPAEIFAEEIGAETMESVSASSIKYKSSEEDIDAVVSDNQPAVSLRYGKDIVCGKQFYQISQNGCTVFRTEAAAGTGKSDREKGNGGLCDERSC